MDLATQFPVGGFEAVELLSRLQRKNLTVQVTIGPQAPQEARRTLNAAIGIHGALLGRACEHGKEAHRVRAVANHDLARFDDIVLRFRHLLDAAEHHRRTVAARDGPDRLAALVVLHVHFARIEPARAPGLLLAIEALIQQHALCEEPRERLIKSDESQIAHRL